MLLFQVMESRYLMFISTDNIVCSVKTEIGLKLKLFFPQAVCVGSILSGALRQTA